MAILSSIPVLNCQSIAATLDFYQQIFQFVIVNKRESKHQLHWVHIMHADTTIMLQRSGLDTNPVPNSNITLYFFVNNINELHHFIKAKNIKVSDLASTDYGMQEFGLMDPEGNLITVGQKA